MGKKPKFSILIPVHNRENLIGSAIESILKQTYPNYELIVIDDGSTDLTSKVIASYGNNLTHLVQSNQGPEIARNAGAQESTGDYLAFLDSDDIMLPWALEVYSTVILHFSLPPLVLGSIHYFHGEEPDKPLEEYSLSIEATVYKDFLSKDVAMGLSSSRIVVKRSLFNEIGGLRISSATSFHADDYNFVLRCGCFGPMILVNHPDTIGYRVHESNAIHNVFNMFNGIMSLISAERRGEYPGGKARLLDRYACIGGPVFDWSKKSFSFGFRGLGVRLFFAGLPMILAAVFKKLFVKIKGVKSSIRLT
jgi:glycosyltransferase involved in cell wall biosynthesis